MNFTMREIGFFEELTRNNFKGPYINYASFDVGIFRLYRQHSLFADEQLDYIYVEIDNRFYILYRDDPEQFSNNKYIISIPVYSEEAKTDYHLLFISEEDVES